MVYFPAPVGGTPFPIDFAPSFTFAVLYAALVPLMLYRMISRRSRSILLIGTIAFSIERSSNPTTNPAASAQVSQRIYMQISFGMGFIGIANDIVNLVRCLLVNSTYGPNTYAQSAAAASKGGCMDPPPPGTPDHPNARQWIRRGSGIIALSFFGAIIPGIIANSNYNKTFDDQQKADSTELLRFISTGVALGLTLVLLISTLLGKLYLPRICNRGVLITCAMTLLIIIISVYRLSVMAQRTTSLAIVGPLDTTSAKVAFYIFHILPEWLATLILFGDNSRKTFGTGLWGDYRIRDETDKEREKREMKEAEKEKRRMLEGN